MQGKLYLISVPIGNFSDMSFRAVQTLSEVDIVACEDTRRAGILLKHFNISSKLMSFHDHNEAFKTDVIVEKLLSGKNIAVISDAGTPCISDPGFRVVRAARQKGIEISGIPGACAAVNALVISGMPTDSFVFEGFLPHKKNRRTKLVRIAEEQRTVVLYESVHRIKKLLNELVTLIPDRKICVLREMTKTYEEHICGTPSEILQRFGIRECKGEFVVVIEGAGK